MPLDSDQVPHVVPYLRPCERILSVSYQPLPKPVQLLDPFEALCLLTNVDRPEDIGKNGPAVASGTLAGREKAAGQGKFTVLFGRDSLFMADAVKELYPQLVRTTLLTLARHIGMMEYVKREEEFGRVVHEVRDPETDSIAQELTAKHGWEWPFYATVDASPLFVRLLHWYVTNTPEGYTFLDATYRGRDGENHSMKEAFLFVMQWILRRVFSNPEHLLEFRAAFPGSHKVQSMEDSQVSHVNEQGMLPNFSQGISSTEDQGHVYQALVSAIEIGCNTNGVDHCLIQCFEYLAHRLKWTIFNRLWVKDDRGGYFASGTHRDELGKLRQLKVRKAIPAFILNTLLWTNAPMERRALEMYVRTLFSKEMMAAPGPRTLAIGEPRFNPGRYHMGTVWPFQVLQIAEGLKRQGFPNLAQNLYERIVRSVEAVNLYPEYFRGEPDGSIKLNEYRIRFWNEDDEMEETAEQPPQEIQGWTVTAYIAAKRQLEEKPSPVTEFEWEILSSL